MADLKEKRTDVDETALKTVIDAIDSRQVADFSALPGEKRRRSRLAPTRSARPRQVGAGSVVQAPHLGV